MNWFVCHVASGQAFFSGLTLIIIAALTSLSRRRRVVRVSTFLALVGVLAVAISSTPIPYAAYGVLVAALVIWSAARIANRQRRFAAALLVVVGMICGALEAPFHLQPELQPVSQRALAVIGDSVTAGLGEPGEVIWPVILAQTHDLRVQDLSHVGETAASALKRARSQTIDAPVVLIEIGGNDILGATTARQFAIDLDALLSHLQSPGRQLVMFELPLPPFFHEFGRIQREAAQQHNVALIPKRVFLELLAGQDATLDSIHLSPAGHRQMAEQVWRLIAPALNGSAEVEQATDSSR